MQNVLGCAIGKIVELMQISRETYHVNPIVFLAIYFGSGPVFYYALYRVVRAIAKALRRELGLWSSVFLGSTAAPFGYVLLFGRGLPWWAYFVITLVVVQAVIALVWKLRSLPAPRMRHALHNLQHSARVRRLSAISPRRKRSHDGLARRCHGLSLTVARIARRGPWPIARRRPAYRCMHSGMTRLAARRRSVHPRPLIGCPVRRVVRRPYAKLYHRVRFARDLPLKHAV